MKDLFGNDTLLPGEKNPDRKSVHAHKLLIVWHGETPGVKCGKCVHFYRTGHKGWPKCRLSGLQGHTQNHDWSSTWQACGKFEKEKIEQIHKP